MTLGAEASRRIKKTCPPPDSASSDTLVPQMNRRQGNREVDSGPGGYESASLNIKKTCSPTDSASSDILVPQMSSRQESREVDFIPGGYESRCAIPKQKELLNLIAADSSYESDCEGISYDAIPSNTHNRPYVPTFGAPVSEEEMEQRVSDDVYMNDLPLHIGKGRGLSLRMSPNGGNRVGASTPVTGRGRASLILRNCSKST